MPESFTAHLTYLANLPVYELSEQLIKIFDFYKEPDAFVQRFQDLVLEYNVRSDSSLDGFLTWWDSSNTVSQSSVITPENEDAIRIMTIHRSKGLQFPIVFIPFAEWELTPKSNQLIWLEAAVEPFDELGKTALMTSSKLLSTHYKDGYQTEVNQTMLDNLNLLYVAFTRPEEKLWIYCPIEKEKKTGANELNSTSKLIYRCALRLNLGSEKTLQFGENSAAPKRKDKKTDVDSEALQMYPSNRWQEKLALSTHSNDLIELLEDKKLSKVNYGILIHALLAEIRHVGEIDQAMDRFVYTGMISENERSEMLKEVNEILAQIEIAALFSGEMAVKSEREVILPTGELLRPDRVLIGADETLVVDFKSGQRLKKHEQQISRYADVLKQMGYPNVKSKLVYLAERKVVEV
ncbi:MAG: hypothetical protein IPP51_11090 [Bacteroidetes bacterium]|nr:hypothetical protein [Bacteroidota bacterium]